MNSTARMIILSPSEKGSRQLLIMERFRRDEKTGEMLHYYSIPGGHIEPDEMPEAAACRELQEEMSVEVQPKKLVAISHTRDGGAHYFFWAEYHDNTIRLASDSPEQRHSSDDNRFIPRWVEINQESLALLHPVFQRLAPLIRQLADGKIPKGVAEHRE